MRLLKVKERTLINNSLIESLTIQFEVIDIN